MASIRLEKVDKHYDAGRPAVDAVDLEVADGEFFVLVGPSGCGKSTLLRMLAGLERPTGGTIRMGGVDVTGLEPRRRDVAMVFQNYAIYPHMSVRKNLGYGLRVRGAPRREIAARVEEVAELLALEPLLDRKPATLSGGQLQRVAMGRAIARRPQVYLMDEPLSNLDAKLRVTMRAELERLHQELGVTTVYVTHDQVEAMTLGQRAAVLRAGVVQQVATPQELYARPANAFVAAFIGSPPMNFAIASLRDGVLSFGDAAVPLPPRLRPPLADGKRVLVGIRPEDLRDPRRAAEGSVELEVECVVHQDLGADVLLFFAAPAEAGDTDAIARVTFSDEGSRATGQARMLCARVGADYPVRSGERARLALAPERIAFFDLESGVRL